MATLTRRAQFALDYMDDPDRTRVGKVLAQFNRPSGELPKSLHVKKVASGATLADTIYSARAGSLFRVFFRVAQDGIEILDIVSQERLEWFNKIAEPRA